MYVPWITVANLTNLRRTENRQTTKAGLCQTGIFTRFQNFWVSQSLSHCTDSSSYEPRVACFSPWAHCWFLAHPLQWSLYGPEISRRGRGTDVSSWMPGWDPTLFHTTMNALCCTTSLPLYGDRVQCYHGEVIFSTT